MTIDLMLYGRMLVVGMVLGAIFFGGLWMTVQSAPKLKRPGFFFMLSVIVRTAVVLAGIWYFASGSAAAMTACLLGFVAFRLLATHGTAIFGSAFGAKASKQ